MAKAAAYSTLDITSLELALNHYATGDQRRNLVSQIILLCKNHSMLICEYLFNFKSILFQDIK